MLSVAARFCTILLILLSWTLLMVNGADNLTPPGVAAVSWKDSNNDAHLRIYFQRDDGFVYEAQYDELSGVASQVINKLSFQPKIGSNLAAVLISQSPVLIRLYYLDTSYVIQECLFDGSWTKGATLPSNSATPVTSLSAVAWTTNNITNIRVYYQKANLLLQELTFSSNSTWSVGFAFANAGYPGTGISSVILSNSTLPGNPLLRVYYQSNDLAFHQLAYQAAVPAGWSDGTVDDSAAPAAPGAGIAAVQHPASDGTNQSDVLVYYEEATGHPVLLQYTAGAWAAPVVYQAVTAGYRAPIGGTIFHGGDWTVRLYLQTSTENNITQIVASDDGFDDSGATTF